MSCLLINTKGTDWDCDNLARVIAGTLHPGERSWEPVPITSPEGYQLDRGNDWFLRRVSETGVEIQHRYHSEEQLKALMGWLQARYRLNIMYRGDSGS